MGYKMIGKLSAVLAVGSIVAIGGVAAVSFLEGMKAASVKPKDAADIIIEERHKG